MRKVLLKVSFQVVYEVPDDWDDEMVLFHCNESSFCTNTLLERKLEQKEFCACSPYDTELLPTSGHEDWS